MMFALSSATCLGVLMAKGSSSSLPWLFDELAEYPWVLSVIAQDNLGIGSILAAHGYPIKAVAQGQ